MTLEQHRSDKVCVLRARLNQYEPLLVKEVLFLLLLREKSLTSDPRSTWVNCCWCVTLASQSPYTIKVYSVANYRPHLSHLRENM